MWSGKVCTVGCAQCLCCAKRQSHTHTPDAFIPELPSHVTKCHLHNLLETIVFEVSFTQMFEIQSVAMFLDSIIGLLKAVASCLSGSTRTEHTCLCPGGLVETLRKLEPQPNTPNYALESCLVIWDGHFERVGQPLHGSSHFACSTENHAVVQVILLLRQSTATQQDADQQHPWKRHHLKQSKS